MNERSPSTALEGDPRREAARQVAQALIASGEIDGALALLCPLVEAVWPPEPATLALLAEAAARLGAPDRAAALLREALELTPSDVVLGRRLRELESHAAQPAAEAPAAPARLDLRRFLEYPGRHVVLRLPPEFPGYRDHSDLDVLCDDVEAFRAHLLACAAPYVAAGMRVEEHREGPHLHVDLFHPGASRLNLRFDVAASVPSLFEKVAVDPSLTEAVLAERQVVECRGARVSVPRQAHELALRLLEYLEWHERRPEKAKHLEYIDRANDFSFLDVINGYTGLWATLDTDRGQATLDLITKSAAELEALPSFRERPPRRKRMDYFMIWGHGLAHAEQILEIIRGHAAFRIVTIVKRSIPDMPAFVRRVYEADTVPLEHLLAKTRYLASVPPEVLFILVVNRDPQEQYFGEGEFRHIQCRHVKAIKEEVRDRFNPRRDGARTEDHVIHGSDYQSQVRHLLSVLGLPTLEHFAREPNPRLDAPYHIEPFERFDLREVPLSLLRARILGQGDVPLEETPHCRYLAGDEEAYRAYHAAHMGVELTDDHFPAAFERLRASFDPERPAPGGKVNALLAAPIEGGAYRILDGVHRAAILQHRGCSAARVAVPSWALGPTATASSGVVRVEAGPPPAPGYVLDGRCQIPGLARLYELFLGYRSHGCFVEFGAFDGDYVSNTSGLADLGWRGLYLEPVPEYFRKCVERHRRNGRVSVLNCAVGPEEAEIDIHVGGPLSTASRSALARFQALEWSRGHHGGQEVRARQRLLESVLVENRIEPGFDLLVVDVEGYEWNSLRRFDIDAWKPRMVIIELHDSNVEYDNEWEDCDHLVRYFDRSYRVVYKDFSNTVYVRRDIRQRPSGSA